MHSQSRGTEVTALSIASSSHHSHFEEYRRPPLHILLRCASSRDRRRLYMTRVLLPSASAAGQAVDDGHDDCHDALCMMSVAARRETAVDSTHVDYGLANARDSVNNCGNAIANRREGALDLYVRQPETHRGSYKRLLTHETTAPIFATSHSTCLFRCSLICAFDVRFVC